jgi:hypothetical protein
VLLFCICAFLFDAGAQHDKFNTARFELHQLLGQPTLIGVPLLVVCIVLSDTVRILLIKYHDSWATKTISMDMLRSKKLSKTCMTFALNLSSLQ